MTIWLDELRGVIAKDNGSELAGAGRVKTIDFINSVLSYNQATGVLSVEPGRIGSAGGTVTSSSISATLLFIASSEGMYRICDILKLANTTVNGEVNLAVLVNNVEVQDIDVDQGVTSDASESLLIWLESGDEVKYSVTVTNASSLSCNWAVSAELLASVS